MASITYRKPDMSLRRKDGLLRYAHNRTSQSGEDGIISQLFRLIPPDHDGRVDYCVNLLYNFDLCICKALEKSLTWFDGIPFELDGLAETIDSDPRIQTEIKGSFRDWIQESEQMQSWCEQCASPSTRLLLCHLYPIMSCLKKKGKTQQIPTNLKIAAAGGKLRSILDPPQVVQMPGLPPPPVPSDRFRVV